MNVVFVQIATGFPFLLQIVESRQLTGDHYEHRQCKNTNTKQAGRVKANL